MHIDELETPVATVDLDILERNIERLQAYLSNHGIVNRPHIKTHKIPEIAHQQIRAGAAGITCQKLGEAEIMVQAGIRDVFVPYNILGTRKLERLASLMKSAEISVTADSEVTAEGLLEAARLAGKPLTVLVEFDTGADRCGVQTPQEAADLARLINRKEGLVFGGLMTYPTNEKTDPFVREVRNLLSSDGLKIERVSAGGTGCMWQAHEHPEVTEYRA